MWIRACWKLKAKRAKLRISKRYCTATKPKTRTLGSAIIVYRDLRSRGYVAREGFGAGIDFRIYERGAYGKDTAPYLVLSTQEGKPLGIDELADALQQCQSQKKEMILAVMNRRGEIVYYSVSQLTFK